MSEHGYFEDLPVGLIDRLGSVEVTRADVIDFASRYDPQPFHLDDAAAAASPLFGRLAASGWHTAALTMRLLVDHWQSGGSRASMGGAGLEELRWLKPVYPGDTLHAVAEVIAAEPSRSRPDRGRVTTRVDTYNQDDARVMSFTSITYVGRRPPG